MPNLTKLARSAAAAGAILLAGCNDWLRVANPPVIESGDLDPVANAALLAGTAQQNFADAYGWMIVYSSWFVGETDVSETFPTRNEFGRRAIVEQNTSLNTDVWVPLSRTAASAYLLIKAPLPNPASNMNLVRAHLWLGYSFLFMAEHFCRGTVLSGPGLSTAAMLDSGVAHLTAAITIGTSAGSTTDTVLAKAALALANTARVGRARAHLQAGRSAQAIADADSVPANFTFILPYMDDLTNRTRLGNKMWIFVRDRGSIAVPPHWRTSDPRIPWRVPTEFAPQDANYAQDRGVPYAIQQKYTDYTTPIRVASKLEADYIKAEAEGAAAQLVLLQARRAANSQPAYAGPTDDASVLTEFLTQKGFDFYLEGKRMGDYRRHPGNIFGLPVVGATYWKPGFAPVGDQQCYPLPTVEISNNPYLKP